ncbi:3-dehydroquinate synthase, partial [Xanthomonas perforans]
MTLPRSSRSVDVDGAQPYTITIAPGLLADGARLAGHVRGRHALLLSDSQVAPHYAAGVRTALLNARPDLQV